MFHTFVCRCITFAAAPSYKSFSNATSISIHNLENLITGKNLGRSWGKTAISVWDSDTKTIQKQSDNTELTLAFNNIQNFCPLSRAHSFQVIQLDVTQ